MRYAILLLILIACTYNPQEARYVIDGDTFVLNNGDTIRLAGIDAPEYGDSHYDKAAYELQRRITGRTINFEGEQEDAYERKVRFIFVEGRNINLELVQEGWARTAWHENTKYQAILEQAQEKAITEQKGIWKINDESYKRLSHKCEQLGCPLGTITVSSKYGEVYYNCDCSAAYLISKENIQCHNTLQEAIAQGLREAKRC